MRYLLSHSTLRLLALAACAVLAPARADAQALRVDSHGYSLFFTPQADSATCVLTKFTRVGSKPVSVYVPEVVASPTRKFNVKIVGEGETGPFDGAQGVWRIALPASVTSVEAFGAFEGLHSIKLQAQTPPALGVALQPKWRKAVVADTLRVPASSVDLYKASPWAKLFNEVAPLYTFTFDYSRPDGQAVAEVSSPANFGDLFFAYTDGEAGLTPRTPITLTRAITFPVFNYAGLDAKTLTAKLAPWPTAEAFSAQIKGSTVTNLAAKLDGLFGTVRSGATIDNLVLDETLLFVNPENETFEKSDDGQTLFVHVIAGRNHGNLTTVGFAGSVVMPKGAEADGVSKYVVSLVGRQGRSGSINGFLFLEVPAVQARGLNYLTDCQGVGIDESLASKVAIRKKASAEKKDEKFNPDDPKYRYTSCAFTDDEFASGLVAYWLNFRGVGFTGDYKPLWRQGLRHPEAETNPARALYKVDYQIDGESFITSAPTFANGGDRVTISYSKKPVLITVGGKSVSFGDESATFSYAADDVVAISWTRADFKPAERVKEPGIEFTTTGNLIKISGAGKQVKGLYTVTGIKICETTGSTLSAPKRGAYAVRIGKRSWRVFVK